MNDTKTPIKLLGKDLLLRDVIQTTACEGMPFNTCVVVKVTPEAIHLFRPFATTADFSYTGGVIPYIGIEQFTIWPSTEVILLERHYCK